MRTRSPIRRPFLCLFLLAAAPLAVAMEVDINFLLGGKSLDSGDWGEADGQAVFGVETTFGKPQWPVAIALDYLGSGHVDDVLVTTPVPAQVELFQGTGEFDFGVRKIWKLGKTRPFVGGGVAMIGARQERSSVGLLTVEDTDGTAGLWFNGGSFWRLGRRFNIGVDFRLSTGKVHLFGRDVQAGGSTLGLLLGWGWGGNP